jgi:hypothetical protein
MLLLIRDLHVRIINAATGELLRDLILDPAGCNVDHSPVASIVCFRLLFISC